MKSALEDAERAEVECLSSLEKTYFFSLGRINFLNFITEAEKTIYPTQGRQNLSHSCGWEAQEYKEKQI